MKAISIRQPWADLIIQGKKTLELRSWSVRYRGPLAIHASQTMDEAACRAQGIDPRGVSAGVLIGVVELVDILSLDEQSLAETSRQHLAEGSFKPPIFGWRLANPSALQNPVPFTGRMGLFNVPDGLLGLETQTRSEPESVPSHEESSPDSRLPFELQVKIEEGTRPSQASYRLAIYQRKVSPPAIQPGFENIAPQPRRLVCELGGTALKAVADGVLEALRLNGYAATDLGARRREPFRLAEESGVRLSLIFLAIRPVTKGARIEEISRGIRAMTGEELYYWFAKCTGGPTAERAQKALRQLLSDE